MGKSIIRVPIADNFGGGYKLEYDGKYVSLIGKDKNFPTFLVTTMRKWYLSR